MLLEKKAQYTSAIFFSTPLLISDIMIFFSILFNIKQKTIERYKGIVGGHWPLVTTSLLISWTSDSSYGSSYYRVFALLLAVLKFPKIIWWVQTQSVQ